MHEALIFYGTCFFILSDFHIPCDLSVKMSEVQRLRFLIRSPCGREAGQQDAMRMMGIKFTPGGYDVAGKSCFARFPACGSRYFRGVMGAEHYIETVLPEKVCFGPCRQIAGMRRMKLIFPVCDEDVLRQFPIGLRKILFRFCTGVVSVPARGAGCLQIKNRFSVESVKNYLKNQ